MTDRPTSVAARFKRILLGRARSPTDPHVFHKVSLVALLAWVGLGSDGISSSCYGPEEAFKALITPEGTFTSLAIFLAIMTAITVFIISASYMQIIEMFPTGGGSYLVASKLINPTVGMVAGSALIVDYVLTITVSIASGAAAIFSFLPPDWASLRLAVAFFAMLVLTVLNLRGVKESVVPIVPVFVVFMITHVFTILYAILSHSGDFPLLYRQTAAGMQNAVSTLGVGGTLFLLLHAYSMGGGTYTGIEAVSNSMAILHEPRVQTGKRTMIYMAISLAFVAGGLIVAYLLLHVSPTQGRTLNAVLFADLAGNWGTAGRVFVTTALISEAVILMVAAQTGFIGGPAVLAAMGQDGWMPRQFALLSDRLVTQNGILLMGGASILLLFITGGNVTLLVILYSINVFLTFTLSQLGMVRHWWNERTAGRSWLRGFAINGAGLALTGLILVTVVIVKFAEGGWITIVVTSSIITLALMIKRHYNRTAQLLRRLDVLFTSNLPVRSGKDTPAPTDEPPPDVNTAVLLVSGFNGLGLHTLFNVLRIFRKHFRNFVFIQVGVVDAGRFKGVGEIENLRASVQADVQRYVDFMHSNGFYAEGIYTVGTDVVEDVTDLAKQVLTRFPHSVVFTGQLIFPGDTIATRLLHNYMSFAIQRRLYYEGVPVLVLPIRM